MPSTRKSPLRVLCCPDSFKGTASAHEAATALATGVQRAGHRATACPFADGGEGTAEILASATAHRQSLPLSSHPVPTVDALGRPLTALWRQAGPHAFMDIASASGLPAVADILDARRANTFGSGLLLEDILLHITGDGSADATHFDRDAVSTKIQSITVCLGGSATTDGGYGLLSALGARLYDENNHPISARPNSRPEPWLKSDVPIGELILAARRIELPKALTHPSLANIEWQIASDVTTTPHDCASVFGPQKGASESDVQYLTNVIEHWCGITRTNPRREGFGAAGGCPIALYYLARHLGTRISIVPGAKLVSEAYGLPEKLNEADFLITGEGHVDKQSQLGKVVGYLCGLATQHGVPVGLVGGVIDQDAPVVRLAWATAELPGPMSETIQQIADAGFQLASKLAN